MCLRKICKNLNKFQNFLLKILKFLENFNKIFKNIQKFEFIAIEAHSWLRRGCSPSFANFPGFEGFTFSLFPLATPMSFIK